EPNDYDTVADLYDAFVQIDFDLEFFRRLARGCGGPLLELMAGTGRATRALHDGCPELT
ncbi:MAG: class I SAM-dependent methyltransferase, partial [Actinobacteria bacterium]|nr:class I SAM-dependent methyltransferase [Actinomycetota bacterium]NIV89920.1 class I SAM-dependent methyltransferase [Actinomycetota bacterium]